METQIYRQEKNSTTKFFFKKKKLNIKDYFFLIISLQDNWPVKVKIINHKTGFVTYLEIKDMTAKYKVQDVGKQNYTVIPFVKWEMKKKSVENQVCSDW